jgi:transcription elongation factor GreB
VNWRWAVGAARGVGEGSDDAIAAGTPASGGPWHAAGRPRMDNVMLRQRLTPSAMSKAFTRESDSDADDDDDGAGLPALPPGGKNYLTPQGYQRLRAELLGLIDDERPKMVDVVSWAAKNGDRSENGDYLYGKKRLREIDRRIRFLTRRLDIAEVADPSVHHGNDQVFFGATVTYANDQGQQRTITIKGIDEADNLQGEVSWVAPIARALLKAREGDEVQLMTPGGLERLEVIAVNYPRPVA